MTPSKCGYTGSPWSSSGSTSDSKAIPSRNTQLSTLNFQLTPHLHRRLRPPGDTPAAGQTALPDDLEQAAVEQVAYWFQNWTTARKKRDYFYAKSLAKSQK